MRNIVLSVATLALLGAGPYAWSQEVGRQAGPDLAAGAKGEEPSTESSPGESDFFKGMSTGIALIRPRQKTVREASVVNGKVVVTSEAKVENTLMVLKSFPISKTTHSNCQGTSQWASCAAWMIGAGFNIGSQGSGGQIIDFLGVGLTVGSGQEAQKAAAWYAGIGIGRRFNQKVLGDGLRENEPLPAGETQVRFKYIDATAPFVFVSLRW